MTEQKIMEIWTSWQRFLFSVNLSPSAAVELPNPIFESLHRSHFRHVNRKIPVFFFRSQLLEFQIIFQM